MVYIESSVHVLARTLRHLPRLSSVRLLCVLTFVSLEAVSAQ